MSTERLVEYVIFGENDTVLAEGQCEVSDDEHEMSNICKHARIPTDDVYLILTEE